MLNEELLDIEKTEIWERWRCEVDKGQTPQRVDKFLAEHMAGTSRNRIQNAADAGNVWVNGKPVSSNYKVKPFVVRRRRFCTVGMVPHLIFYGCNAVNADSVFVVYQLMSSRYLTVRKRKQLGVFFSPCQKGIFK